MSELTKLQQMINLVREQIRDKEEPVVFARATDTNADELEPFVLNAVADYSRWYPLQGKREQISIITGQTDYVMSDDFIEMADFGDPAPEYRLSGQNLYLMQPPDQSSNRVFFYNSMHTPDTVPDYDKTAVVLFAASLALRALHSDPKKMERYMTIRIPEAFEQEAGGSTKAATEVLKMAEGLEKQYLLRVGVNTNGSRSSGDGGQKTSGLQSKGPFATFG